MNLIKIITLQRGGVEIKANGSGDGYLAEAKLKITFATAPITVGIGHDMGGVVFVDDRRWCIVAGGAYLKNLRLFFYRYATPVFAAHVCVCFFLIAPVCVLLPMHCDVSTDRDANG